VKRVLVTGASGLVGAALVSRLSQNHEIEVYVTSHVDSSESLRNIKVLNCDFSKLCNFNYFPERVDTIIHLAMSPFFKDFPEKCVEVFNVNTVSTMYLLDYAVRAHAKKFIFASSGVYDGDSSKPHMESEEIRLSNIPSFYLSTKVCSEILLNNFTHFFDIHTLRLFFVYGKNQRKEMLIPRIIENIKKGKAIYIDENGGIKINPINIHDAANAIYECLGLDGSHIINIAGDEVVTMKQLADMIGEMLDIEPIYEICDMQQSMVADNLKMKDLLIAPSVRLKDGISEMI